MNVTVIGAGNLSGGYRRIWAAAGHPITFSYALGPAQPVAAATASGPNASYDEDPASAVRGADVVVLCIPWAQVDDALGKTGDLTGALVADAFTPPLPDMSGLAVGFTTSGAEQLAAKIPGARVVTALQNTFADVVNAPTRRLIGQNPTMFFCGDDPDAKSIVATLIGDAGYEPVDAGPLAVARHLEPVCFSTVTLAYAQGLGSRICLELLRG